MIDPDVLDWAKMDGLLPAIVQDAATGEVRMLGYMDRAALDATIRDGFVTFRSRSRDTLWRKGETSGNLLEVVDLAADCDRDAILVRANPRGPTCHTGAGSCFSGDGPTGVAFLVALETIVASRAAEPTNESYTATLMAAGVKRIAQKVGEEGIEVALAGAAGTRDEVVSEAADLAYHLTVLLRATGASWADVVGELRGRHANARTETASS